MLLVVSTFPVWSQEADTPFFTPMTGQPASTCSGCHGMDAAGNREGSRLVPAIRWSVLSRPAGRRTAYDPATFARAVSEGIDPDGRELSSLMPRYRLSDAEFVSLVATLRRLDDRRSHGVAPDRIVFGAILPEAELRQPRHDRGARIIRTLFDEVNSAGGIYGRKLALEIFDGGDDFLDRIGREPVLAVLLDFDRDRDGAKADRMAKDGIPELFPVAPIVAGDDYRRIRGFTASEGDIAERLVDVLIGTLGSHSVLISSGPSARSASVRRSAETALRSRDIEPLGTIGDLSGRSDATVLVLDPAALPPCTATPMIVAGSIDVLASIDDEYARRCRWRLVFADPRFEPDPSSDSGIRLRILLGGETMLDTDRAAFVAAELAIKAVRAAGRSVNRRTLVEALGRIGSVETGIWPMLNFGKNPATGTRDVRIGDSTGSIDNSATSPDKLRPE